MTPRLLRLILLSALAAGALVACSDGGHSTGSTTEESLFDDFFSAKRGAAGANDAASGQETSAPCDPDAADCQPGEHGGVGVDVPALVCERPYPAPAAATAPCQAFCAKVASCIGEATAVDGCTRSCRASLGGHEVSAASEVLACFVAAECADIQAWRGLVGDAPTATEPGFGGADAGSSGGSSPDAGSGSAEAGSGSADAGSSDGSSDPPPPDGRVPAEDDWTPNPIDTCIAGVLEGWAAATLPASKQAVCDVIEASDEGCTSDDTTGSSGGSSSSSDPDGAAPPDAGSSDAGAPEPMPPREQPGDDDDHVSNDDAKCTVVATLLTQGALDRIAACAQVSECGERSRCLSGELVCLPFLESMLGIDGGSSSGGGTVGVDVPPQEPHPGEAPTPR